jgi:tape measure domain-containing protein
MTSGMDRATRNLNRMARNMENVGKSLTRVFSIPIALAGAGLVRSAAQFDKLERGLIAVAGSAEEAELQIARLQEVAKLPGLGFKEAIAGSTRLQAAGLSAELAERSLKAFGNALATVGGGRAELDGVTLALGQIASAGKVMGQEIRQLQQRLPQIRQAMIAAFGSADTEVLAKMEIDAQDFITAIVREFEKLAPVTTGLSNEMENLSDSFEVALRDAGKAVTPFALTVIEELNKVVVQIGDLGKAFAALPEETRATLLKTVGAIAAAPIGVTLIGKFIKTFQAVEGFILKRLIPAFAAMAGGIRLVIPALLTLTPAMVSQRLR